MKIKINLLFLILLQTWLSTCSNHYADVYLWASDVTGLSVNSLVSYNGFQMGHVKDLQLDFSGKILITLELEKDTKLPIDSKFFLQPKSISGDTYIEVEIGSQPKTLKNGDTIFSYLEERSVQIDSEVLKEIIDSVVRKRVIKTDSLHSHPDRNSE